MFLSNEKFTNFTSEDLAKALAIVNIFETSRPIGNFTACVVLGDGAGVSYGISQFTHRSGSLAKVVERYLATGADAGRTKLRASLPLLRKTSVAAIRMLAADAAFKNALRAAGRTPEMQRVQIEAAFDLYLSPAIEVCRRYGFREPLSLAVIYDSLNHGSWERIAARVRTKRSSERLWITDYVRKRHLWLTNVPRLAATNYRTRFFLGEIERGNWALRLPLRVHGYRLTERSLPKIHAATPHIAETADTPISETEAGIFDGIHQAAEEVRTRADSVKSLWATVGGTAWQAAWAAASALLEIPREVWIVAAVIAGVLVLAYIYRQTLLGRIREEKCRT
ncbi:MAG: chitosanase [Acidobacteriota bacterium]|nr:MAG: chitosanase [Acidobacteriota bacterium]